MRTLGAERSFYHRVTLGAVLVVGVGLAVYVAAIPAGDPQAPLFVPVAIVVFAIAALIRRTPKALWVPVLAGPPVLAVLALDPFRLLHPDSFIDFVPNLFAAVGTAAALVAGAIALWERRHGTERAARPPERIVVLFGVAGLVAVTMFSAIVTFTRPATITLPGGQSALVVDADQDRWVPDALSVPAGASTLVLVRNPDWIAHTFSVPGEGIDVYVAPRTERTVEIGALTPGRYAFECSVTGHDRMVGALRVF